MQSSEKKKFIFWKGKNKKIITLILIITVAWILGQWIVPAIMKAIFL